MRGVVPVGVALLVALSQFAWAFLAFDLILRVMPVGPGRLREAIRRYGRYYAGAAVGFALAGSWIQVRQSGLGGLLPAILNPIPWWLIWRFGLRKQFPFLFRPDGGRPKDATEPDR